MKYLRVRHQGAERLGRIAGDSVELLDGDLFGAPRATGETVPLAGVESHSTVLIMAPGKPVLPSTGNDATAAPAGSAPAPEAVKP